MTAISSWNRYSTELKMKADTFCEAIKNKQAKDMYLQITIEAHFQLLEKINMLRLIISKSTVWFYKRVVV